MGPEIPSRDRIPARKGTSRVPALDGFRAYAILGVVLVHLLGASGVLAATSGTGVAVAIWAVFGNTIDVFFIISGFVLFLPTLRHGGEFGSRTRFWIGRAVRLFPVYWLVLAIMIALLAFGPELYGIGVPSLGHLAAHLAVLQMPMTLLDSHFAIGFGINGPLWLLSIVVTFYALLPFVARPYFRHPLVGLAIAAAVTIVWKQTVEWAPDIFESLSSRPPDTAVGLAVDQFPGWAFSFGLGMTAAWAYELAVGRYPREMLNRTAVRALAVALPVYALVAYLAGRHAFTFGGNVGMIARQETFEAMLQSGLRATVILIVILGPVWMLRPFVNRTTKWLAELSYGVYLIHWVIVIYLHEYSGLPTNGTVADLALWMAVVLPPSLLFAALSRRWFELPIQRWVLRRNAGPPPVASPQPARGPGTAIGGEPAVVTRSE
jgi:peptidoglycan/LPS O-acetylase OafA/YrhL